MSDLGRLVRRLVEVIETKSPGGVHRPISIAELRGELVPYRTNRNTLGLSSSEDYDLLVLRLLAEEGGYVRAYPPDAADQARAAVQHPNPDLLLVEMLGEATVQIGAATLSRVKVEEPIASPAVSAAPPAVPSIDLASILIDVSAPPSAAISDRATIPTPSDRSASPTGNGDAVSIVPAAPATPPATTAAPVPSVSTGRIHAESPVVTDQAEPSGLGPSPVPPVAPAPPPAPEQLKTAASCPSCQASLPTHREVSFCPHCGARVKTVQCPRCGGEVEVGWRHCVVCGQPADRG